MKKRVYTQFLLAIFLLIGGVGAILVPNLWKQHCRKMIEQNKKMITRIALENAAKVTDNNQSDRIRLKEFSKKASLKNSSEIHDFLKTYLTNNINDKWLKAQSAGVAFENGKIIRYTIGDKGPAESPLNYEHTDSQEPATQWYRDFLTSSSNEGMWKEPYYGKSSQAYSIEYGVPFVDEKGNKAGVAYVNYSIEHLRQVLSRIELGTSGYGFIAYHPEKSDRYTIVAHPYPSYLQKQVMDVYKPLKNALKDCLENNEVSRFNSKNGPIWIYAVNIQGMGDYKLFIIMDSQAMVNMAKKHLGTECMPSITQTQSWIISGLFAGLAILAGLLILVGLVPDPKIRQRLTSLIFALVFLGETIFLWVLYPANASVQDETYILTDPGVARTTVKELRKISPSVPLRKTGVFVQSVKFVSPYEVKLTGYIWQLKIQEDGGSKYVYNDDAIVIFPEAEDISISKKFENDHVVGSYFKTVLRQPFDYTKYPFDTQNIWIRMWPSDFVENRSVLIPYFESYSFEHIDQKIAGKTYSMGLEEDLVMEGWDIKNSYFSYVMKDYTVNFAPETGEPNKRPELHFNMLVRRRLGGVIISHILPIAVISILLFGVAMIKTNDKEKSGLLGFSVATVLAYCASLFFVLIVSHISLRNRLETPHFVYLEGFYFIMYFQILLVSMHDLIFALSKKDSLLRRDNGIFQKLLYWPTLTFLILAITLYSFF